MPDILLTRRKLIGGIGLALAAPFVVKAASLMPVRQRGLAFSTKIDHMVLLADYPISIFPGMITYLSTPPVRWFDLRQEIGRVR